MKVKALEEAIYKEKCPFKPTTSSSNKGHKHGDEEEDEEVPGSGDEEGIYTVYVDLCVPALHCTAYRGELRESV